MLPFSSKPFFCSHLLPKNINLRNVFYLTSYTARQLVLSPHENTHWQCLRTEWWGNILTEDREVTVGWGNPDNEELCNQYYSSIIVRAIKTCRMRCAEMYKAWEMINVVLIKKKYSRDNRKCTTVNITMDVPWSCKTDLTGYG